MDDEVLWTMDFGAGTTSGMRDTLEILGAWFGDGGTVVCCSGELSPTTAPSDIAEKRRKRILIPDEIVGD